MTNYTVQFAVARDIEASEYVFVGGMQSNLGDRTFDNGKRKKRQLCNGFHQAANYSAYPVSSKSCNFYTFEKS